MLPNINRTNENVSMINQFGGLNKNLLVNEGEFADMTNMTNDCYPIFSNRAKRGNISELVKPQGAVGGKCLAYVDNNKLYYNDSKICNLNAGGERQLVMMGALLCVFPDGIIYNTESETVSYVINKTEKENVSMTLCKLDGTNLSENTITSDSEPSDKTKYWLDTSSSPIVLKMYSTNSNMWVSMGTTYVKFEATGIGTGFKDYDAAKFSGVDKAPTSGMFDGWDFNQTNIIYKCSDNYVVVAGLIDKTHTNTAKITISREMPDMDYIAELNNRLYACSSEKHEIYACKLGDPTNWNFFGGLDSDSYAVTVGTQNNFTGIASFGGYMYFFKDNGYHKMYGTKPSNFELSWKAGRGVQEGSAKSVCIVNEYLMLKSRDYICLYDGSMTPVGEKLGMNGYYDAVAGAYRNKYYVSMRDADYNYALYVYDIAKGTWTKEGAEKISHMAYSTDGLYLFRNRKNENKSDLYLINSETLRKSWYPSSQTLPSTNLIAGKGAGAPTESSIEWAFETGDFGLDSPYHHYIKRINVRMALSTKARMSIDIMYDSSGAWENLMTYYCTRERTVEVPVSVKRSDHFRLRFSGHGDIKLYSIAKVVEEGSGL